MSSSKAAHSVCRGCVAVYAITFRGRRAKAGAAQWLGTIRNQKGIRSELRFEKDKTAQERMKGIPVTSMSDITKRRAGRLWQGILRWLVGPTAAASLCALPIIAQTYPSKPVRMIVPFPPGGGNDILGRVLAAKLSEQFGQQVVIDNRAGAGSIIGTEIGARAAPDGHTLLFSGTAGLSINPILQKKLPYDPIKDFAPVSMVGTSPQILAVHPMLPVWTVQDLIDLAKAKPGRLNFASAGIGTPTHLAGELFKHLASVDIVHIPYKGGGPALTDVLAGQVSFFFRFVSKNYGRVLAQVVFQVHDIRRVLSS